MAATDMSKVLEKQKELEKAQQKYAGKVPYWKPKEGENRIRILPAPGKKTAFWAEYYVVHKVGPNKRTVIPRHANGLPGPDPYQEYFEKLQSQKDEISRKEAQQVMAKKCYAVWIIDRDDEAKGPQLWTPSQTNYFEVLSIMADRDYKDICSIYPTKDADGNETGAIDLTIIFTPKEKNDKPFPKYDIRPRRKSSPLGNEQQILAWTSEDLFEKYHIGEPADVEWLQAVIDGTDAQFVEALKAKYAKTNDEVRGVSMGPAPPPPSAPGAPPAPGGTKSVDLPNGISVTDNLWMSKNGAVVGTTAGDVASMVLSGEDPTVMTADQKSGWVAASSLGFVLKTIAPPVPIAPPPPTPPVDPPVPPPPATPAPPEVGSEVPFNGMSEMDALRLQLSKFQNQTQQSVVGADLRAQLSEK